MEFSHRSGRDLVNMAKKRTNVIPIIEDARHPAKYRMLVGMVDVIFSDVAQPDQVYFAFIIGCIWFHHFSCISFLNIIFLKLMFFLGCLSLFAVLFFLISCFTSLQLFWTYLCLLKKVLLFSFIKVFEISMWESFFSCFCFHNYNGVIVQVDNTWVLHPIYIKFL